MRSALAGLETAVCLVDNEDPSFTPYQAVIAMAIAQRSERIADLHRVALLGRFEKPNERGIPTPFDNGRKVWRAGRGVKAAEAASETR
jgi:hypothetical protein